MSDEAYIWAHLQRGNAHTAGYILKKPGVKVGAMVEMTDYDGELWEITKLSDEKSREYVKGLKNKGRDFAHSI